jgi:hypothetical protein
MGIESLWTNSAGDFDMAKAAATAAGAAGVYALANPDSKVAEFLNGAPQQPIGYTAGIPEYEISRSLAPNAFATTTPTGEARVPGSGGRRYFSDTTYTPTGKTLGQTTAPVNTTPQSSGLFGALSPEAVQALLASMFGSGGVSGGTTTGGTTTGGITSGGTTSGGTTVPRTINWDVAANAIRAGTATPSAVSTQLSKLIPGSTYDEETVVYNLSHLHAPAEAHGDLCSRR